MQRSDPQKLLHIAQELLHTEEAYVRRLHLLDQVAQRAGNQSPSLHVQDSNYPPLHTAWVLCFE